MNVDKEMELKQCDECLRERSQIFKFRIEDNLLGYCRECWNAEMAFRQDKNRGKDLSPDRLWPILKWPGDKKGLERENKDYFLCVHCGHKVRLPKEEGIPAVYKPCSSCAEW